MIFQIDESTPYPTFPDPRSGDEDGLFAVGGDLSIDRLLLAYCHGIFPWYSFRDQPDILWYCPMQRFVIFPEEIHVSHSMRTLINKDQYSYSINEAFDDVIAQCSKLRIEQDGAWLGDDMIKAYTELHRQGFASSRSVGRRYRSARGRTLWRHHRPCVYWREYVLPRSLSLQAGAHLSGPFHAA